MSAGPEAVAPPAFADGAADKPGPGPDAASAGGPSPGADSKGSDKPDARSSPAADTAEAAAESHSIGSDTAVASATAAKGLGSLRREFFRRADLIRTLGTVEGDAVGGDKVVNIFGGGEKFQLRLMSPILVESARKVFVAPRRWDDVLAFAVQRRVVVLRGSPGHGRTTAALRLLPPHADPVFHLGAAELARLNDVLMSVDQDTNAQHVRGAGFVLDDPVEFASLDATALRGLQAALEAAEAQLIMTADSGVKPPGEDLVDSVFDLPGPPDPAEVLAAHLRRRLSQESTEALLTRPGIRALLDEQLTESTACSVMVRLADILAYEELSGGAEPEQVRRRLSRRAADDFATWFGGLRDIRTRCHAVALAVLEGVGQETVAVAADDLARRLEPRPNVLVTDAAAEGFIEREDPFSPTQDELLGRLRARTVTATVDGGFGRARTDVVEYLDPAYPAEVLRHVWTRHRIHDDLLDWLTELVRDPSPQIRILAGSALGTLATLSFDFVCRGVLVPWAFDEDHCRREAVAVALRVASADPGLAANVRTLTGGWYANREQPLGQATAALVHGWALGSQDHGTSVEALLRLMAVDDSRVGIAVGHALAELVATGDAARARGVLTRLADAAEQHSTTLAAQLAFLLLAVLILVERPAGGAEPERATAAPAEPYRASSLSASIAAAAKAAAGPAATSWPYLLDLATLGPAEREPILRLWRRALEDAPLHDAAAGVLASWAASAESDPGLREAFTRLSLAIAKGHDRARRILLRLAATWTEDDNLAPLPKTADALRRVLDPTHSPEPV